MMTFEEAIRFLESNQPLPNDSNLSEHTIQKYDQVREYFLKQPHLQCVPLFLNSFGEGSGFGVYQLIEDVITQFSHEEVMPYLLPSMQSKHKGVRYWCSQIASSFPDAELISPLIKLLNEQDSDIRYSALTALAQIEDERILLMIRERRALEADPELLDLMDEILDELE